MIRIALNILHILTVFIALMFWAAMPVLADFGGHDTAAPSHLHEVSAADAASHSHATGSDHCEDAPCLSKVVSPLLRLDGHEAGETRLPRLDRGVAGGDIDAVADPPPPRLS